MTAAEREVGLIADVHVHLDDVAQPTFGIACRTCVLLQPARARDGRAQLALALEQMPLARAVVARQAHRRVERVLEDREPETSVRGFVEVLIVHDHVQRHDAGAVVSADRRGEGGEIRVRHHRVADVVDGARVPLPPHELVRPQHVVLSGRPRIERATSSGRSLLRMYVSALRSVNG